MSRVKIFAHRGSAMLFPENSMHAFRGVHRLGVADGFECDVRMTKDKKLIIIHDKEIPIVGSKLPICNSTFLEVQKKYDCRKPDIPLFEEVCEFVAQTGLRCFFEVKDENMVQAAEAVDRMVDGFRKFHIFDTAQIIGFHEYRTVLFVAKNKEPKLKIALMPKLYLRAYRYARRWGIDALCYGWTPAIPGSEHFFKSKVKVSRIFSRELRYARQIGVEISGGVANTPEDVEFFYKLDVDGIWTDDILMARNTLNKFE